MEKIRKSSGIKDHTLVLDRHPAPRELDKPGVRGPVGLHRTGYDVIKDRSGVPEVCLKITYDCLLLRLVDRKTRNIIRDGNKLCVPPSACWGSRNSI